MQVPDLKLAEISFSAAPTKTQLVNMLRTIHSFLGSVGASLIMDGSYTIADPPMGALFNGAIQLRASADGFEGGPNSSGLAIPQGGPRVVGR